MTRNLEHMTGKSLLKEKNIEITFDESTKIMYCRWIGFQNKERIVNSGLKILDLVKNNRCSKILNDNVEVSGPWQDGAEWTAKEWFPAMEKAGLKHFGWVFSDNIFSALSAKKALPSSDVVTTFGSVNEAMTWLKSKD